MGVGQAATRIDPSALTPGLRIADRYRLDRPIGQGGMGSVWAASHMVTQRAVALKFLRRSGESGESRLRFLREARAACAVVHPNVVTVLDFLEPEEGAPIMVLELLEGESLAGLLSRVGRLSVAETADLMSCVVSAVGTAHAEGVVHRDLKPDNIFLHRERDGSTVVKVLDFGIAKVTVLDEDTVKDAGLTHTGALLGTPMYMSPEQVFGETDLDHRADIWALGIILYRCLAGVVPTEGSNVGQIFKIIVAGKIPPLSTVAPDVPESLSRLVDSMLNRDRGARPSDLRPVLEALEPYATRAAPRFEPPRAGLVPELGSSPRTGEAPQEVETLALGDPENDSLAAAPPARGSRARWLVVAAALGVIGLLGGLLATRRTATLESEGAGPPSAAPAPAAPPSAAPATTATRDPFVREQEIPTREPTPATRAKPRIHSARPLPAPSAHPDDPYGF